MQSGESQPVSRLNSPDGVDSEISQPDAFTEAILEAAGPAVDTSVGHTKMYLELVSDSAADFITRRQQNEGLTFLDAFSLGGGKTQRDIFDCVEEVCTELLPGEHPREQTAHNMAIFDAYADMLAEEKTKVVPVFDPWEASSFTPVTKIKQRQLQQQQHDASAAAVGAAEVNRLVVERLERASKWNLGAEAFDEFAVGEAAAPVSTVDTVIADEFRETEMKWLDLSEYELALQCYIADVIVDTLVEEMVETMQR